jgi:hypothetical protein
MGKLKATICPLIQILSANRHISRISNKDHKTAQDRATEVIPMTGVQQALLLCHEMHIVHQNSGKKQRQNRGPSQQLWANQSTCSCSRLVPQPATHQ